MSVRNDVTVDFSLSPRIITVLSPSTSITIQDLHDTLRSIEDDVWNMSFSKLISSAGKENLGGGVLVGVTSTLQNAKLAFQERSGPSYIQCRVDGGNLVAIDANGNSMSAIEPTAFTQVILANSSSATLVNDLSKADVTIAVWDESALSGRVTADSLGKRIIEVLKLKRYKP